MVVMVVFVSFVLGHLFVCVFVRSLVRLCDGRAGGRTDERAGGRAGGRAGRHRMAQDAHKTIRDTAGRHGTTQDTHRTTRVERGHAGQHGTLRSDMHRRKTLLENLRPPPECPRTLEDKPCRNLLFSGFSPAKLIQHLLKTA